MGGSRGGWEEERKSWEKREECIKEGRGDVGYQAKRELENSNFHLKWKIEC